MNHSPISRHVPKNLLAFLLLSATLLAAQTAGAGARTYLMYVGTYTDGTKSDGIYAYRFRPGAVNIEPLGVVARTTNPSWIALHPSGKYLYAVNEVPNYNGQNSGGLSAFSIDHATGKLTLLNQVSTRGADPCYVTVDGSGKYVLVANYTGGSVAAFPILSDGKLGEASSFIQHKGHGPNAKRQDTPHAHSVDLSPDNRLAYVDDLGLDELLVYKFDSAKGTLTPNDPPFASVPPGSGPRHFAVHPLGKFVYVVDELTSTVTAFEGDVTTGKLHEVQTITTLPAGFQDENNDAEIEVHPSGKFLYASNRGNDSITVFSINQDKGTLTTTDFTPARGQTPRSFAIDPTGQLLFVGNQKSDMIVVFSIDQKTGKLKLTGQHLTVGAPVCIKFLAVE